MIEQYLNDSITGKDRKAKVETLSKLNLIPPRIYREVQRRDSLAHSKDSAYLIAKGYIKMIKDTMDMDAADEEDALDQLKKDKEELKKTQNKKDSTGDLLKINPSGILPDEKKKPQKDSLNN